MAEGGARGGKHLQMCCPAVWHITCRWEAYISVTQYYIFRSNCMPSCARAVDKETLSQCETRPDRRKHRCKEWSKDVWSDQPWKGDPREVRIVGIPAAKTLEQELASQGKLTSTMITWFERHWVESGLVGGDGGDHLQPPLCSAESHQNPFPTKAWHVFVNTLQCALISVLWTGSNFWTYTFSGSLLAPFFSLLEKQVFP